MRIRNHRAASRVAAGAAIAVAVIGSLLAPPATASSERRFAAPASIATDCSVDVTPKLNRWISSVPDNSTLAFAPGGCYRIERTVMIKNRHGLTLEGNGATFRAFTDGSAYVDNPSGRNHFYLWGGSDLVVRNLKVQGVNTAHRYLREFEGQRGFRIAGVQGALLKNVTVYEVRGDFVEVDPDYYQTWRWSNDITIRNSTFDYSGRQGFSITGGRRILFTDNHIAGAPLAMFDIEPDSGTSMDAQGYPTYGGAADVSIVNNDVGWAGGGFLSDAVVNPGLAMKNIVVSGNRLTGIPLQIEIVGHPDRHYKNFTITNNTSDTRHGGPRGSIELVYVDGAVVSGNRVPFWSPSSFRQTGVKSWGSTDVVVRDNKLSGAQAVLEIDGVRFGSPWSGTRGGNHSACGNRFGRPPTLELDSVLPVVTPLAPRRYIFPRDQRRHPGVERGGHHRAAASSPR